jgi:hypothetical protein
VPDGRLTFIVFQRDLAMAAPPSVEVRIFAKVASATTFDSKGKPISQPLEGLWSLRNISQEFKAVPGALNSDIRAFRDDSIVLAPGRYALVFDGRGYDFAVDGVVKEASQCLERLDAANGSFYSECRAPATQDPAVKR